MFCPNCGTDAGNSKFCPNCGTQITRQRDNGQPYSLFESEGAQQISSSPPAQPPRPQQGYWNPVNGSPNAFMPPPAPHKPKKKLKGWMVAIIVVAVFAIILTIPRGASENTSISSSNMQQASIPVSDAPQQESIDFSKGNGSPDQNTGTLSVDAIAAIIEISLQESFGENYTIEYDDTGITVNIWSENVTPGVTLAINGDSEALKAWESLVENFVNTSVTACNLLKENGHSDVIFSYNILNELNKDNYLLMILNGEVIYDVVSDSAS